MKKILSLFAIINFQFGISCTVFAQKEINFWCFGMNAGIDFNSGSPVPFSGAAIGAPTLEGCSSIADASGNLLFYTDGSTVWNKNHVPMPSGVGLLGSYSTSQGALIVPKPGSPDIYFVFSIDLQNGPNGIHYSVVDMTAAGGLGDVVQLNVPLNAGTLYSEKMIGIRHANGNDFWVIVHTSFSNVWHAYEITSAGISTTPVVSAIGQTISSNESVGTMHCTLDGTRIAAAYWGGPLSAFEVFDFDKNTGTLSNPLFLTDPNYFYAYSVCFSPDGRYLYGACCNAFTIYQFDLSLPLPTGVLVGTSTNFFIGDMQFGPDSIIYVSFMNNNFLSAILSPDSAGLLCNFTQNAVSLPTPSTCQLGLPNYIYQVLNTPPVALFNAPHHICPGTCTDFTNLSINGTSYEWTFAGANPSTSTDANPTNICYNTPGNYSVSLIATNVIGSDTLTLNNYMTVYPYPAPQGIAQNGDTLFANQGAVSYQWYHTGVLIPGATDYFYIADASGDFNVVATDSNGCEVEAAIFDVVASVQSTVSNDQLAIYPNPVADKCTIRNSQFTMGAAVTIKVLNILGVAVQSEIRNQKSEMNVDTHALPSGIYWLEVSSGEKIFRTKFIKQ